MNKVFHEVRANFSCVYVLELFSTDKVGLSVCTEFLKLFVDFVVAVLQGWYSTNVLPSIWKVLTVGHLHI